MASGKAAEILAKAQQLRAGDGDRAAKRARSVETRNASAASSQGAGDTEILARALRLTLSTAEKCEAVSAAANLVVLLRSDEDHAEARVGSFSALGQLVAAKERGNGGARSSRAG